MQKICFVAVIIYGYEDKGIINYLLFTSNWLLVNVFKWTVCLCVYGAMWQKSCHFSLNISLYGATWALRPGHVFQQLLACKSDPPTHAPRCPSLRNECSPYLCPLQFPAMHRPKQNKNNYCGQSAPNDKTSSGYTFYFYFRWHKTLAGLLMEFISTPSWKDQTRNQDWMVNFVINSALFEFSQVPSAVIRSPTDTDHKRDERWPTKMYKSHLWLIKFFTSLTARDFTDLITHPNYPEQSKHGAVNSLELNIWGLPPCKFVIQICCSTRTAWCCQLPSKFIKVFKWTL